MHWISGEGREGGIQRRELYPSNPPPPHGECMMLGKPFLADTHF